MRFFKIAFLAVCCLLLSACSSFQPNLTDLMQSPKLTEEQAEIYEAPVSYTHLSSSATKSMRSITMDIRPLCIREKSKSSSTMPDSRSASLPITSMPL